MATFFFAIDCMAALEEEDVDAVWLSELVAAIGDAGGRPRVKGSLSTLTHFGLHTY
jgi:hypothetical protein